MFRLSGIANLLRSNYALAMLVNDWKEDRFFPQTVAFTTLQFVLIASDIILLGMPVLKEQIWQMAFWIVWGLLVLLAGNQIPKLLAHRIKKTNILHQFSRGKKESADILPGITTTLLALMVFLTLVGWKVFALRFW